MNMLGDFSYCNPTRIYFGENAMDNLCDELNKYGKSCPCIRNRFNKKDWYL